MAHNVTEISINRVSARPASRSKLLMVSKTTSFLAYLLKTASMCCYLFTVGILKQQNRWMIRKIWHMTHLHLCAEQYIPPVEIASLVPSQISVQLCEQSVAEGNTLLEELLIMVESLEAWRPAACFEIGTFDGRTALNMAANTPEKAVIYTLYLPRDQMNSTALPLDPLDLKVVDKEASGIRYQGTAWEHKIQQLYGDSATFDYTPYQNKIDFIFIDGSHTYEYILNYFRNAMTLLRDEKGIILWHDYTTWPSVRRLLTTCKDAICVLPMCNTLDKQVLLA